MIKQNKSEPGRPTKLNPESEKLFLNALQVGSAVPQGNIAPHVAEKKRGFRTEQTS